MKTRVIIADDHAIIREGLKSLFEKKGMDVIAIARNGREAIDFAISYQPDVVIMDISMPDLNGVEATAVIRKKVPKTKVIALSMHSNKKNKELFSWSKKKTPFFFKTQGLPELK